GMDEVPVIELAHLSPTQKRALILADTRIALDAGWDEELLALEFAELADAGYDLALTGFNDAEIDALLADELGDVEGDGQAEESVLP
ncbi:DNA modification methylase, partial [Escherichia coli]